MRLDHRPRDIHRSGLNWYGFKPTTRGKRGDRLLTRHRRMSHLQHDGCVTPSASLNNRVSSIHQGTHTAIKAPIASLRPAGGVPFNGDTVISSTFTGHFKR